MLRPFRELVKTLQNPAGSDVEYGINFLFAVIKLIPPRLHPLVRVMLPGTGNLFDRGYDPQISLESLLSLPAGTLGHEYAKFIANNKLKGLSELINFAPDRQTNILQYVAHRAYKVHDILHVTLSCPATVVGEVRIVSFTMGQSIWTYGSASIALLVLLTHIAIKEPRNLAAGIRLAASSFRDGKRFGLHITFPFEDHWHKPVEEVRAALERHDTRAA